MNPLEQVRVLSEAIGSRGVVDEFRRWSGRLGTKSERAAMLASVRAEARRWLATRGAAGMLEKHVVLAKSRHSQPPRYVLAISWAFTPEGDTDDGEWERVD